MHIPKKDQFMNGYAVDITIYETEYEMIIMHISTQKKIHMKQRISVEKKSMLVKSRK